VARIVNGMTQMAMRIPYSRSSVTVAAPLRRRLRGAAMAAAFMVGSATVKTENHHRYADRGVALTPVTSEPLWAAPAPAATASPWTGGSTGTPATAATLYGAITGTSQRAGFVYQAG
jgi:hypothetical protein